MRYRRSNFTWCRTSSDWWARRRRLRSCFRRQISSTTIKILNKSNCRSSGPALSKRKICEMVQWLARHSLNHSSSRRKIGTKMTSWFSQVILSRRLWMRPKLCWIGIKSNLSLSKTILRSLFSRSCSWLIGLRPSQWRRLKASLCSQCYLRCEWTSPVG